jgi:hypothetical protein
MAKKKIMINLIDDFAKKHKLSAQAKEELKKLCTQCYARGSSSVLKLFDY